ncbi:hypothetical protein LTR86_004406 [Recurvomyces mirabilis]|nr:hypothetical protein LTR86_004406 [Recurvomyces mirabilis]
MPSLEDSRRQVEKNLASLSQGPDHNDILARLQDEIDKHNAVKDGLRETVDRERHDGEGRSSKHSSRSAKFRFKDGIEVDRKRVHRSHRRDKERKHKRRREEYPSPPSADVEAAHPFPREPTTLDEPGAPNDDAAFRNSLFDALADDEGAAYWEGVYEQPIHIYDRPTVSTSQGELEQMSDAEYAAHVKTKMWERKHPEVVIERERSERKRKEAEEERAREREAFIRRKEQAAWERAERRNTWKFADDKDKHEKTHGRRAEYEFAGEANTYADVDYDQQARKEEYVAAWARYLTAWDRLKLELLDERTNPPTTTLAASKRIPWPVLKSKPVIRGNIEDFLRHGTRYGEGTAGSLLKAERVRWHPDKVQQRFAGKVEEGTMKLVTGVFQVVDALFEEERKKS